MWLKKRESYEVVTLSVLFHNRNEREVDASRTLARKAGVKLHLECSLPYLREAVDLDEGLRSRLESKNIPSTLIPYRNLIFYSLGSYFAVVNDCSTVVVSHNKDDIGRFPDVSHEFVQKINELLILGAPDVPITVEAPLLNYRKEDVFALAVELGVPLSDTWSCWGTAEFHCGRCLGCETRKRLFASFGLRDDTVYIR